MKPANAPWHLLPKQTWRDSLPTDLFLSAVSVLVAALPSSEIPEGFLIYPVYVGQEDHFKPKSPKMNTIRKCRNIQVKQQNTSEMNTIKCRRKEEIIHTDANSMTGELTKSAFM
jgi:hypothetical protein